MAVSPVLSQIETANGELKASEHDELKLTKAEQLAEVTPVSFAFPPGDVRRYGADPTGVRNSDAAFAMAEAVGEDYTIPTGRYLITETISVSEISVYCDDAYLDYQNGTADQPVVWMGNNSRFMGSATIYMPNGELGVDVNHLRVGGGRAYTDGSTNVRIGKITVLGGHETMAAVLVEGASSDVHIEEVNCPDNPRIGQPFGCHWGNFNQHHIDGSDYVHTPGGDPTTHPKRVRVERVIVGSITQSDGFDNAAVFISSSRDISIGYLEVGSAGHAAVIYGGDIGFEYASDADKNTRMYGIEIEKIVGKTRSTGVLIAGATSFPSVVDINAEIEFASKFVHIEYPTITGSTTPAISTEKVSRVTIDNLFCQYYDSGVSVGAYSQNVTLNCPRIADVDKQAINAGGISGGEVINLRVTAPYITRCNRANSSDELIGSGIVLSRVIGAKIIGGVVGTATDDTQRAAFAATSTCKNITVESVYTYGSTSDIGFYASSAPTDAVSFINCGCDSAMTLRSGGQAVLKVDQKRIAFSSAKPSTGTWEAGDIAYQVAPATAGLPAAWQCITAGSPGTWAVMAQAGPRTSIGATPEFVGQLAVVAGVGYIATGTGSAADWDQIT